MAVSHSKRTCLFHMVLTFMLLYLMATAAASPMPQETGTVGNPVPPPASPDPTKGPPPAPPTPTDQSSSSPSVIQATRGITGAAAIAGIILVSTGFTYCFLGRRSYIPALFLGGFFTLAVPSFIILDVIQRNVRPLGPYADWIYLILILPVSVLGGFIFYRIHQIGTVSAGMILGFTWAMALLFTGIGANLTSDGHMIFVAVMTAAGAAAVFFMEHLVVILGTANGGGIAIVTGVDLFARTGFCEVLNRCMDGQPPRALEIPGPAWGLLATAIVLAMSGWFVQTRPAPPPPPSQWNPAYWLFGAARPPPLPPTWFKFPPGVATEPAPPAPPPQSWASRLNPLGWKW